MLRLKGTQDKHPILSVDSIHSINAPKLATYKGKKKKKTAGVFVVGRFNRERVLRPMQTGIGEAHENRMDIAIWLSKLLGKLNARIGKAVDRIKRRIVDGPR